MTIKDKEYGIIKKVFPETKTVLVSRYASGCGTCSSQSSCVTAKLNENNSFYAKYTGGLQQGDKVEVVISPSSRIMASLLIFLLPLLFLFFGYFIVFKITSNEPLSALFSVLSLFISFTVIWWFTTLDFFKNIKTEVVKV